MVAEHVARNTVPFAAMVPASLHMEMAMILGGFGFIISIVFFLYQVVTAPKDKHLAKEIIIAAIASVLLGFGTIFALLGAGVYV